MKRILFLSLSLTLFLLTACGPRGTWNYLVMGGQLQAYGTKLPEQYKAYIETDQRVIVEIKYYTGYSAGWILEQMDASQNLRDLIVNADKSSPSIGIPERRARRNIVLFKAHAREMIIKIACGQIIKKPERIGLPCSIN